MYLRFSLRRTTTAATTANEQLNNSKINAMSGDHLIVII